MKQNDDSRGRVKLCFKYKTRKRCPSSSCSNFCFFFPVVHLPFCFLGGSWGTFQPGAAQDRQQEGWVCIPEHSQPDTAPFQLIWGEQWLEPWQRIPEEPPEHWFGQNAKSKVQIPLHRGEPRVFPWMQHSLSPPWRGYFTVVHPLKWWGWDGGTGNPIGSIAGWDFLFTPLINVRGVARGVVTLITCEWQLQQLWE